MKSFVGLFLHRCRSDLPLYINLYVRGHISYAMLDYFYFFKGTDVILDRKR